MGICEEARKRIGMQDRDKDKRKLVERVLTPIVACAEGAIVNSPFRSDFVSVERLKQLSEGTETIDGEAQYVWKEALLQKVRVGNNVRARVNECLNTFVHSTSDDSALFSLIFSELESTEDILQGTTSVDLAQFNSPSKVCSRVLREVAKPSYRALIRVLEQELYKVVLTGALQGANATVVKKYSTLEWTRYANSFTAALKELQGMGKKDMVYSPADLVFTSHILRQSSECMRGYVDDLATRVYDTAKTEADALNDLKNGEWDAAPGFDAAVNGKYVCLTCNVPGEKMMTINANNEG